DIGGESTRPFSDAVTPEEEIRRVVPVIERLAPRLSVPISIDTTKAAVARHAIEAGASIINDISSLRLDPVMADVAATHEVPIILMHMLGTPKTMQLSPEYSDLIGDIRVFFQQTVDAAEKRGIARSKLILDPGIGFGKSAMQNLLLIQRLHEFASLDLPLLIGASRKSFLRKILKDLSGKDRSTDEPEVETGSQAAICAAILNGAHMIRVHDVANSQATVKITDAVMNAG
ncbi:MAG: dihydropteroate synthase, partial [Desulfobacterales bacterium]